MTMIPLRNFGKYGVIAEKDTQQEALPIGTWSNARNIRFSGASFEKMLEPRLQIARDVLASEGVFRWGQGWSDGLSSYFVAATDNYLYFWRASNDSDGEWIQVGGPYETGQWQGFAWGNTVVANNGKGAPQIFDTQNLQFVDLPKWGLISNANDITDSLDPSVDTAARCRCLVPLGSFLVAIGVTESGLYRPNTAWWSNATPLVGFDTGIAGTGGPPDWDYESPGSLSGKRELGVGDGALTWAAELNESLICYTERSATALAVSGGSQVMSSRRLFGKGAAGLHCAAEFNNKHFVLSRDEIYLHDGSTVQEIAKDRVEEEFWTRAGRGGRFGANDVDFNRIQVVKNPDRKEINLLFDSSEISDLTEGLPPYKTDVTAVELYQEPTELEGGEDPFYTPEGCLFVHGTRIISNPAGDRIMVSSNLGASWVQGANVPLSHVDGWRVNCFAYHPGGAWFMYVEKPSLRESHIYRSKDEAQTWEEMDREGHGLYSSTAMIIDSFGRLVSGGQPIASNDVYITRWNDPVNNSFPSENKKLTGGNQNIDNLKETDGGYMLSTWDSLQQSAWFVPFDLSGFTEDYNVFSDDDYTPVSFQLNGDIAVFQQVNGDDGIWDIWNPGVAGAPNLNIDFTENLYNTRINTSPDYVTAVGNPTGGDQARWLMKMSLNMKSGYGAETVVHMPTNVKDDTQMNIYWAYGHNWIGHYINDDNRTVIILFNLGGFGISSRECLVYNYEDDNYTFQDAATQDADLQQALLGVEWMTYDFIPGWQVRWSDLEAAGTTWQDLEDAGTRWSDFYKHGDEEAMFWLNNEGLWRSDMYAETAGNKNYYVERVGIDLDDMVPQWTTNLWKFISEFYFHLQSPSPTLVTPNEFSVQFGWAETLMDEPTWELPIVVNLDSIQKGGEYKADTRTAGRYLSLRLIFNTTQRIKMSGADINAEEFYGR